MVQFDWLFGGWVRLLIACLIIRLFLVHRLFLARCPFLVGRWLRWLIGWLIDSIDLISRRLLIYWSIAVLLWAGICDIYRLSSPWVDGWLEQVSFVLFLIGLYLIGRFCWVSSWVRLGVSLLVFLSWVLLSTL